MNNNNRKTAHRQCKPNRNQLIIAAQKEWEQDAKNLATEKAGTDYKDLPWDEFLELEITDDLFDTATQSQIIDLQARYKELIPRQELLWAEDRVISEFNKIHAIVHVDQTYILTEKNNVLGGQDFSLESRQSLMDYYEDETILCIDGLERCKAKIWLKSPKRRKYKGIVFDPRKTECDNDYYNLWRGFAKQPIQGDCSKYWTHVKENVCNNNEEAYQYLRKWLACVFQQPDFVHTAIVLCGAPGVGKNSFVDPLGVLLGSHYAPLSNISELVSNFNYHLKNAVLIHANEALWGGNKKEIGTVKAMITEQKCLIEGKGKDRIVVKNFKHVILSSNEDWPVHLDPDDRRFFVLHVSDKHQEDHAYFNAIKNDLENGGYEALLYDLLHENIVDFNPRTLPSCSDSFSIKIRSAGSSYRYLYDVLCQGGFSIGSDENEGLPVWGGTIPKSAIYEDYTNWCQNSGERASTKELLCRAIKKLIPSVEDTRPGGGSRARCYKFGSLKESRDDFCKMFKEKPERIFDDYTTNLVQDTNDYELPF